MDVSILQCVSESVLFKSDSYALASPATFRRFASNKVGSVGVFSGIYLSCSIGFRWAVCSRGMPADRTRVVIVIGLDVILVNGR